MQDRLINQLNQEIFTSGQYELAEEKKSFQKQVGALTLNMVNRIDMMS